MEKPKIRLTREKSPDSPKNLGGEDLLKKLDAKSKPKQKIKLTREND